MWMRRRIGCEPSPRSSIETRHEREASLVETERLSNELDVRDAKLADLQPAFDAQEAELENARLQLECGHNSAGACRRGARDGCERKPNGSRQR